MRRSELLTRYGEMPPSTVMASPTSNPDPDPDPTLPLPLPLPLPLTLRQDFYAFMGLPAFLVTDHERVYRLSFWAKVEPN